MSSVRMDHFVAGFLFSLERDRILLIQKRPGHRHAGLLNGVGGLIEEGESPEDAMEREFVEEAGIPGLRWSPIALLRGSDFEVHFFAAFGTAIDEARAQTDEQLVIKPVVDLFRLPVVPNVRVLVPLALDRSGIVKPVLLKDEIPAAA